MPPGPQHDARRPRWRHPLVRLVRVQPRQHALGDGLRGHRPGRHQHDARGLCRCAGRGDLGLPPGQEVGRRHQHQRTARRPRGHHLSVLLGVADRRHRHRCDRRRRSWSSRSTSPSGSGSTTPAVRSRCTAPAASGARSASGCSPSATTAMATASAVKGLFYGGDTNQLVAQIKGSVFITAATLAAGLLLMFAIKAIGILRISEAGRARGSRHPRARCSGVPPGARVRGLLADCRLRSRPRPRAHRR